MLFLIPGGLAAPLQLPLPPAPAPLLRWMDRSGLWWPRIPVQRTRLASRVCSWPHSALPASREGTGFKAPTGKVPPPRPGHLLSWEEGQAAGGHPLGWGCRSPERGLLASGPQGHARGPCAGHPGPHHVPEWGPAPGGLAADSGSRPHQGGRCESSPLCASMPSPGRRPELRVAWRRGAPSTGLLFPLPKGCGCSPGGRAFSPHHASSSPPPGAGYTLRPRALLLPRTPRPAVHKDPVLGGGVRPSSAGGRGGLSDRRSGGSRGLPGTAQPKHLCFGEKPSPKSSFLGVRDE